MDEKEASLSGSLLKSAVTASVESASNTVELVRLLFKPQTFHGQCLCLTQFISALNSLVSQMRNLQHWGMKPIYMCVCVCVCVMLGYSCVTYVWWVSYPRVQVCAHCPALLSGVPEGQATQRSAPLLVRLKGQHTRLSQSLYFLVFHHYCSLPRPGWLCMTSLQSVCWSQEHPLHVRHIHTSVDHIHRHHAGKQYIKCQGTWKKNLDS